MKQYKIITAEYTDEDGTYYYDFHRFDIGTIVEISNDDGTDVPEMAAVSGEWAGLSQYVPYACVEAI